MTTRTQRLSALSALLLPAASALLVADVANATQPTSSLEGAWRVTTTPYACETGELLTFAAFEEYMTFGARGTLAETTSNPAFQPGQRSPGHGFWERTRHNSYRAVFQAFVQFTSVVTPPTPPRYVRGTQRVDHGIDLIDSNHWESTASVTFFDAGGTLIQPTGCAAAAAVRIE